MKYIIMEVDYSTGNFRFLPEVYKSKKASYIAMLELKKSSYGLKKYHVMENREIIGR